MVAAAGTLRPQALRYPDTTYVDGSNKVHVYKELGLTILSVDHGFEYVFIPKDVPSFASVAREKAFRYMINASFFDGERLDAQHAGWLRILGTTYAPVRDDRQLTHIVRFDTLTANTDIVSWKDFKSSNNAHTIEFQTGPLVVRQNMVASTFISNSINGAGKYTRTLIAVSDSNELWFITVRKPVSLDSLGRFLLSLSPFQKKRIDVVNLDGGPSVAFYARPFRELNYNIDDRLPLLLGVK
jgi:exopolysaccharide biosynthesis protein